MTFRLPPYVLSNTFHQEADLIDEFEEDLVGVDQFVDDYDGEADLIDEFVDSEVGVDQFVDGYDSEDSEADLIDEFVDSEVGVDQFVDGYDSEDSEADLIDEFVDSEVGVDQLVDGYDSEDSEADLVDSEEDLVGVDQFVDGYDSEHSEADLIDEFVGSEEDLVGVDQFVDGYDTEDSEAEIGVDVDQFVDDYDSEDSEAEIGVDDGVDQFESEDEIGVDSEDDEEDYQTALPMIDSIDEDDEDYQTATDGQLNTLNTQPDGEEYQTAKMFDEPERLEEVQELQGEDYVEFLDRRLAIEHQQVVSPVLNSLPEVSREVQEEEDYVEFLDRKLAGLPDVSLPEATDRSTGEHQQDVSSPVVNPFTPEELNHVGCLTQGRSIILSKNCPISVFSTRYPFTYNGKTYFSVEQFMMAEKAAAFDDTEMRKKIMTLPKFMIDNAPSFQSLMRRGFRASPRGHAKWERIKGQKLYLGNCLKFSEPGNNEAAKFLVKTGDKGLRLTRLGQRDFQGYDAILVKIRDILRDNVSMNRAMSCGA